MFTNTKIYILLICFLYIFVSGCSKQGWHEGFRKGHIIHCNTVPTSEYDDCIKEAGDDYKDYEKKRESVISDK